MYRTPLPEPGYPDAQGPDGLETAQRRQVDIPWFHAAVVRAAALPLKSTLAPLIFRYNCPAPLPGSLSFAGSVANLARRQRPIVDADLIHRPAEEPVGHEGRAAKPVLGGLAQVLGQDRR